MAKDPRRSLGKIGDISTQDGATKGEEKEFKGGNRVSTLARVLTVIAYIISVSTAAALLSAYYIFLWVPHPTEPMQQRQVRVTDSPFSLPQHGNTYMSSSYYNTNNYPKNSYNPSSMELGKHHLPHSPSRASKKAHSKTTPTPNFLPRPQYLVRQAMPPPEQGSLSNPTKKKPNI